MVRALLRVALEPAGSRLVEAADGSEALEVAWREQPDLVLLDVGLPKLSGVDVCRALKTSPRPPRVLLVTGNTDLPEIDSCGADGVVVKPFRPVEPAGGGAAGAGGSERARGVGVRGCASEMSRAVEPGFVVRRPLRTS